MNICLSSKDDSKRGSSDDAVLGLTSVDSLIYIGDVLHGVTACKNPEVWGWHDFSEFDTLTVHLALGRVKTPGCNDPNANKKSKVSAQWKKLFC